MGAVFTAPSIKTGAMKGIRMDKKIDDEKDVSFIVMGAYAQSAQGSGYRSTRYAYSSRTRKKDLFLLKKPNNETEINIGKGAMSVLD